ncbi:rubrerythrin family protein [bacterium]|nr:rubrerythrin family protein [bacterium]
MGDKTLNNLAKAFAGESQANRKYLAFAKKAEAEGNSQVAKLFRAAAEGETIHALAHLSKMGVVGSTAENLQKAISGETEEFTDMYPKMITEAEEEGEAAAKLGFSNANEVEKRHAELYQKALDNLGNNPESEYFVCSVCGYLAEGEAPQVCPVCGAPMTSFEKVE